MPREVHIGSNAVDEVGVGGVRVPVIAGSTGVDAGSDMVRYRPQHHDRVGDELSRIRGAARAPLLVELDAPIESAAVMSYADALIVDAAQAPYLPWESRPGPRTLPVMVRRGPSMTLDVWIDAAAQCAAAGAADVVLWEGGGGAQVSSAAYPPELALLSGARQRTDAPIVVDVTAAAELAGPAVTAGADGIATAQDADVDETARIVELATTLAPFGHRVESTTLPATSPASLIATRQAIDQVDACLANLLERRASLAGLVQQLKPVGGFAGRDLERERALVTAMARRAPRLGPGRMRRIMEVVIEAGLDLAESESFGRGSHPGQTGSSGTCRSVGDSDVSQAR